jgi:hypothetical protein
MKFNILLPLSTVVLAGIIMWAFTACKTTDKRTSANNQLPESCSLLAMSPKDRAAHQQRLDKLCKASRLRRETTDGFEFTVDLRLMSAQDLQMWMENEQKCCSFLQMTKRILDSNTIAEVAVVCPPEMRGEVMRTFGLRTDNKAH